MSLAESMAMVDEILANGTMDRMDRIEKLESLLSAATNLASPSPTQKPIMVDSETQVISEGHIPSNQLTHLNISDLVNWRYCDY